MDAKPQRPLRSLRIRDENAQPQLPAGKTIHQRNKSTPALSTLVNVAAMKAQGAKRAVFADVSNVTRQVAKDDIHVGKSKENIILKDTAIVSAKELVKPNALLRPAQRPLNTKTNATVAPEPAAALATKPTVIEPTQNRKALLKKATTIFREPHVDPAPEAATTKPFAELPHDTVRVEQAPVQPITKECTAVRKQHDGAPVDAQILADVHNTTKVERETRHAHAHVEVQERYEYVDALEEKALVLERERSEELAKLQATNEEEYWDEDEDEYYDADGYTTGRSLPSGRDNTTGGVTLVLAPRITAKSKRELEAAKLFVEANKTQEDIEDEQWDTSMVAEYGDEIFEYMHSLEERMKPNAQYMDLQAEIQWSMRSVLMDWMVQVHNRFTLLPETLFLAVNYVDRFLSAKVVSLGKLQLVGATALFLAAKYEEINCPSVQEIVYMVDGAYTIDEVLKAERFMLSMLQFELGWPGPMSFLRRVSKADDYDVETRTLAKYFLEITIMDERFVGCTPSFLAAGAHCLARSMLKKGDWLRSLLSVMLECCENPQKHHAAVYDKYTDKRYKRASVFVGTELNKGFQLPFASRDSLAGHSQSWRRK
ncbi:B-type cyclin [Didymosphaeria variabile]|uniref:B-type cyclin n=1 Tax=Didymosphaeria variabile TaxID=1932322 RepID=A0A9W8XI15_9PLEO|nr:B-type cyclin [Didymosphaeria variabile]KAJ4351227.1 B-type cyclin [Didymosphaeria variabile]